MESKKLALLCRDLAENRKAENVVILDVRKISSITDYFVIASGMTEPHLRAIASEITDRLREGQSLSPRAVEGDAHTPWQVLDYFDVIVHIMRNDLREKYDLEGLWGDAGKVAAGRAKKSSASPKAKAPGRSVKKRAKKTAPPG